MTDKPDGKRDGPGSLYWIAAGGTGMFVATIGTLVCLSASGGGALTVRDLGPFALITFLLGVPAGTLVGAAVHSARHRQRGWIVLAIIVAATLAGWITTIAMETYAQRQMWGPHPLF
jgi:hypothetical protein